MRTSAALRVGAHVCLFLGAAAVSPLFLSALWLPFVTAALILAADLVAVGIENKYARTAVAALPALVLIFSNSVYTALVLACPIIYSVIIMAAGRFAVEIWRLRREALILLLLCLPILLVSQLAGYEELFGVDYPREPTYCTRAFLFCAAMLIFLALRAARSGRERSSAWQLNNLLWFFVPLAVAVPVGLFAKFAFIPVMKFVAIVLSAPLFALIWLGNIVFTGVFNEKVADWETIGSSEEIEIDMDSDISAVGGESNPYEYFIKATHAEISKETLIIIGIVIMALVLITAAVLMIRRGRRVKGEYLNDGSMESEEEQFDRRRRSRRRGRAEADYADRVRFTYRQYLSFLRMHGIVPDKSTTSGDISNEARAVLRETDDLLRELYRKARYGRGAEVTKEDAELAQETYLNLVNDKNIKSAAERRN